MLLITKNNLGENKDGACLKLLFKKSLQDSYGTWNSSRLVRFGPASNVF